MNTRRYKCGKGSRVARFNAARNCFTRILLMMWMMIIILSLSDATIFGESSAAASADYPSRTAVDIIQLAEVLGDKWEVAHRDKSGTSILVNPGLHTKDFEITSAFASASVGSQKAGFCESGQPRDARLRAERGCLARQARRKGLMGRQPSDSFSLFYFQRRRLFIDWLLQRDRLKNPELDVRARVRHW